MTEERKAQLKAEQRERGLKYGKPNLKPLNTRPIEEVKAIASKAGKASVEARRKKRDIKAIMDDVLSLKAIDLTKDETICGLTRALEEHGIDTDIYTIINAVQAIKAVNGSTKSAEYIRDTSGDKPDNRVSIEADITTEADRALMASLSDRMDALEAIQTTASEIE